MKLVYVAPRFPLPEIGGDKLLTMQYLADLGSKHEVHFVCFAEHGSVSSEHEAKLRTQTNLHSVTVLPFGLRNRVSALRGALRGWPLQLGYYCDERAAALFRAVINRVAPQVVVAQTVRLLPLLNCAPHAKKVLHFVDALSRNYLQSAASARGRLRRGVYAFERARLRSVEIRGLHGADLSCAVAAQDASYLEHLCGADSVKVRLMPLGIDTDYFTPRDLPAEPNFRIGFVGHMRTRANEDAALWFAEEILPVLRAELGRDVGFVIIGARPTRRVQRIASSSIRVTGEVPDIRPLVWECDMTVAPLRISTGIQYKILQSLAMGRPVVATEQSVEGLQAEEVPGLFTIRSADDCVRQLLYLFAEFRSMGAVAREASEYIANTYSSLAMSGHFTAAVEEMVSNPAIAK
jgi:polysaccharide biosynthesis protein PslH